MEKINLWEIGFGWNMKPRYKLTTCKFYLNCDVYFVPPVCCKVLLGRSQPCFHGAYLLVWEADRQVVKSCQVVISEKTRSKR